MRGGGSLHRKQVSTSILKPLVGERRVIKVSKSKRKEKEKEARASHQKRGGNYNLFENRKWSRTVNEKKKTARVEGRREKCSSFEQTS